MRHEWLWESSYAKKNKCRSKFWCDRPVCPLRPSDAPATRLLVPLFLLAITSFPCYQSATHCPWSLQIALSSDGQHRPQRTGL